MKHAYKSFLLENEIPIKVCGDESLYALQNTSNNTVTLQGSNTATEWANVIDIPAGTTKHIQSAFAFLKANGKLHINRSHGSLFNPSLVDKDGNAISKNNPMPFFSVNATGQSAEAVLGREWIAEFSCAAIAAKYSKIALYNPVGSGKKIAFFSVNGAVASGAVAFTAKKITSVDGMTEIVQSNSNRQNIANDTSHTMKAYYSNDASLSSSFSLSRVNVSAVYPLFSIAVMYSPTLVLNEGEGALFEANTVNATMYIRPLFCEFEPMQML